MFTVADRDRIRAELLALAESDPRIVAAGEWGSLVDDAGNRWADLDLTFALAEGVAASTVADDWAARLRAERDVAQLFDLLVGDTLYRVFLYPGALQVDLSWTPRAIPQRADRFRLLFGTAVERLPGAVVDPRQAFGLAVHDAVRARLGVERGRTWSALWCIDELRNETLALACLRRGLPARFARGFDDLPAAIRSRAAATLPGSVEPAELLRALVAAVDLLLDEGAELVAEASPHLERDLLALRADELR
jgi:hypothetical protein